MVSNLFKHVLQVFTCLSMLAESRVFMSLCDFVCGDYIDHDDVVCSHVCCCCVLIIHGDNLMCRKCMVVCYVCLAEWSGSVDVVVVVD